MVLVIEKTGGKMKPAVILNSFGTSSTAVQVFDKLEDRLGRTFPKTRFVRTFSSRQINHILRSRGETVPHLGDALSQLSSSGYSDIVVQSLHLFPGWEFHSLLQQVRQTGVKCRIGSPLLTSPADYLEMAELLAPLIEEHIQHPVLVLGHGTDHPVWTAYYALETIFRQRFGPDIHVGVIEKFPDSTHLIDRFVQKGCTKLSILPLFMVAGLHYRRDIMSDDPAAWSRRLQDAGIEVSGLGKGVAEYKNIELLIERHIREAL